MGYDGSDAAQTAPGAFARDLFRSGTIASRYVADTSQDNVVLADYEQRGVTHGAGGWEEYHTAKLISKVPLKEGSYSGRRVDSMSREKLLLDKKEYVAFSTDYSMGGVHMRQAHSQMAVWAFCDALGIHVPRHHWFPDNETVVVNEVGGADERVWDPLSVPAEVAERVNQRVLLDYISVLLITGNEDLRPPNFKIGDEEQVHVFDFDKSDCRFESPRVLRPTCNKAMRTVEVINQVRDEELSIDRDEICSRVRVLSTRIQNSPHMDRILGTVGLYDDIFQDETGESFEDLFRNNIMVFAEENG
jgi:hypothetical protein